MNEPAPALNFQPLYQQAIDLIERKIARGEWPPGTLLPSEPKLAEELGVSVGTIRKALQHLAAVRLVERRQGIGTFVAVSTPEKSMFRFFRLIDADGARVMPDCEEVSRKIGVASRDERRIFNGAARDTVCRIVRRRLFDDRVIMIDHVVLPMTRFAGIADIAEPLPTTLYDFYESRFGVKVLRVEERLGAITANGASAKVLGVAEGEPLLEIDRIAFSFGDEAVERRISRLHTGRLFYLSELA